MSDRWWELGLYAVESFPSPIADKMSTKTILLLSQIPAFCRCEAQFLAGESRAVLGELTALCLFAAAANFCEHRRIQ